MSTSRTSSHDGLSDLLVLWRHGLELQHHLPPRPHAELRPLGPHRRFLGRLELIEIDTERGDAEEPVLPEQTLVDGRRLRPKRWRWVEAAGSGVLEGAFQQLARDAAAPVRRVRDDGVDDESVAQYVFILALVRLAQQLRGEEKARVIGVGHVVVL